MIGESCRITENGFTLIELLTVVAIIGVLAAIAIPQFSGYRTRAFDGRSLSDLRNTAAAEEAYFAEFNHFVACSDVDVCKSVFPALNTSPDVQISVSTDDATQSFTAHAYHPQGSRNSPSTAYTWNNNNSGLQP